MRLKTASFYIGIFTTLLLVLSSYSLAYAQNCDSLVVDEADVFKGGIGSVEEAAKRVQNLGAEVRIRTFVRGSQLEFMQEELERSCQSWRAADGGTRNNLISLLMSVDDGQFGFFVGSQWANALNRSRQNQIENDYIFPRFRDDKFAEAFVAGLDQVARVIDAQVNSPLVSSTAVTPMAPVVVNTEPADLTGLWWVLAGVLFIGVVVGLVIFYNNRRKEEEKRRAAQQKALMAKREVSAVINSIYDSLPKHEARIAALSGSLSKEEVASLTDELEKVRRAIDSVSESFSRIGMGKSDAEHNNLTSQEYTNIESEYRKLNSNVVATENLESRITHLTKLAKELRGNLEDILKFSESVSAAIKEIDSQGFQTEAIKVLFVGATQFATEAEKARTEKNLTKAEELAKTAKAKLDEVLALARSLPERKRKLDSGLDSLKTRIVNVDAFVDKTHLVFEKISAEFAESSWESVKGNGIEAEERLAWVTETVEEATSLASMENQKWDEAEGSVKEMNQRLDEAESLMRSIIVIEENLRQAKRDSSMEISNAEADIKKAWDYINQHDDDISEDRETELRDAEKVLLSAKSELGKAKPNYLRVVKLAQEANSAADKILENSRTEHEEMERLRQKDESSERDAKAAYSKAKEYIEDHTNDVGKDAKSDLTQANTCLSNLKNVSSMDLNGRIKIANDSEQFANNAYKKAKKNVDDAEESRETSVSTSYRPSSPTSWSSRPSISRPSVGGSRSWGSSSPRIGGSRSLGSSARIGGSRSWK